MASAPLSGIRACVFDAYGTLFDFNSAARQAQDTLGDKWRQLSEVWRSKQLQYTWLRSLMGRYVNFWQLTGEALDFALATMQLDDPALRDRLMNLYLSLDAYPDVRSMLRELKAAGIRTAILSNGEPKMLASAVSNSGIGELLDAVLSVEEVGIYKPHPSVYRLAENRLTVARHGICFVSSNAWDAYAAKAFGMQVAWCNRFGQAAENLPEAPDREIRSLAELPALVLAVSSP
jgi:2-haloacid dehalogenase